MLAVTKEWGEEGGLSVVIRSTQLLGKTDREDRPAMVFYRDGDDSMRSSTSLLTLLSKVPLGQCSLDVFTIVKDIKVIFTAWSGVMYTFNPCTGQEAQRMGISVSSRSRPVWSI